MYVLVYHLLREFDAGRPIRKLDSGSSFAIGRLASNLWMKGSADRSREKLSTMHRGAFRLWAMDGF